MIVDPKLLVAMVMTFFIASITTWSSAQEDTEVGSGILRTIEDVRQLTVTQAQRQIPVELSTQLVNLSLQRREAFIHDGRQGIYVRFAIGCDISGLSGRGALVELSGVSEPGEFLPYVTVHRVHQVGVRALPEPVEITEEDFANPGMDCQWVTFAGTIIDWVEMKDEPIWVVTVKTGKGQVTVLVPFYPTTPRTLEELSHQPVRINAVAATLSNERRQMTERYFQVQSLRDFVVLDLRSPPHVSIANLLRKDSPDRQVVTVQGTVIEVRQRSVFLRGEDGCLKVEATRPMDLEPGTFVEATGQVEAAPFSPLLRAMDVQVIGQPGNPPQPVQLPIEEESLPTSFHHELVRLDATLKARRQLGDLITLQCEAGGHYFDVQVDGTSRLPAGVDAGAKLRLTGICEFTESNHFELGQSPYVDFRIFPRSLEDLKVLKKAPWWNTRRLLIGSGALGGAVLVALAWGISLRKKVTRQTEFIAGHIEREAVSNERRRMAQEFHDTLQQQMTGVAMQLSNVEAQLGTNVAGGPRNALGLARKMLEHCREEARSSIVELRSSLDPSTSLEGLLDDVLVEEARLAGVDLKFSRSGQPYSLPVDKSRHVVRIAREAFSNAIRHAAASLIRVNFDYRSEALEITVEDDGVGFDAGQEPPDGHFGLVGMLERARRIEAELRVMSRPGFGTEVVLEVPRQLRPLPLPILQ